MTDLIAFGPLHIVRIHISVDSGCAYRETQTDKRWCIALQTGTLDFCMMMASSQQCRIFSLVADLNGLWLFGF